MCWNQNGVTTLTHADEFLNEGGNVTLLRILEVCEKNKDEEKISQCRCDERNFTNHVRS